MITLSDPEAPRQACAADQRFFVFWVAILDELGKIEIHFFRVFSAWLKPASLPEQAR
jgi:hypothetical protein